MSATLPRDVADEEIAGIRDISFAIAGNHVDVSLRVEATTAPLRRVLAERIFKTSVRIRNAS